MLVYQGMLEGRYLRAYLKPIYFRGQAFLGVKSAHFHVAIAIPCYSHGTVEVSNHDSWGEYPWFISHGIYQFGVDMVLGI